VLGTKNITEIFNQYFLNVGVNLADEIKPSSVNFSTFLPEEFTNSFYFYPTDAHEVISACNVLKIKVVLDLIKLFLGLPKPV